MKVLFTTIPALGSFHPLLPVARALVEAGDEVAFCASPSFRSDIEAAGFEFFAAGIDWTSSDPSYRDQLARHGQLDIPSLPPEEMGAWVMGNLFAGVAARAMLPDVIPHAGKWNADVIVRISSEFSGCAAAERLEIPHASVGGPSYSALTSPPPFTFVAENVARLRELCNLPDDPHGHMLYRYLHLCFMPPQFDGPDAVFPDTAHFLAHSDRYYLEDDGPAWVHTLSNRPTVYVSMGTVFYRTPGIYDAVLSALRDEPINLVIAAGPGEDPARFGPQPPNVRIERYLPQPHLLRRSDCFVTHGGFNSVKEAITAGVPMVIIPLGGDQFYSAERCRLLGMSDVVEPCERTPARIREATLTILRNGTYRMRVQEMQQRMEALPSHKTSVHLLHRLHEERQPLMGAQSTRGATSGPGFAFEEA